MAIHDAVIAVDFDGTVVTHAYPEIGEDAGAVPVLKELTDNGCRIILYSMRHGKLLDRAVEWFKSRGIPLYAVNENPQQKRWTSSPKVHADLYIDDSNLGCPLRFIEGEKRPRVIADTLYLLAAVVALEYLALVFGHRIVFDTQPETLPGLIFNPLFIGLLLVAFISVAPTA